MWTLSITPYPEGWVFVPEGADAETAEAWRSDVVDIVVRHWDRRDAREFRAEVGRALDIVLENRPEGVLRELLTWPMPVPPPMRVVFALASPRGRAEWEDAGYRAVPFLGSPFGDGTQYTRAVPEPVTGLGSLVEAAFAFDRGDAMLCISVFPVPAPMFLAMSGHLEALIAASSLVSPDGSRFWAGEDERVVRVGPGDTWADVERGTEAADA